MSSTAATWVLVSLLLAQTGLGEQRQEPADYEPQNAGSDTLNFVSRANATLDSFGSGSSQNMPYSDFEVFGRADTAKELTRKSLEESDKMIDQIEKAEVAETKRSVYRSLTRLRGAATAAFDGVARSQVGNLDQYAAEHRYLDSNKVKHLADEESNTEMWAFPKDQASLAAVKRTNPKLWRDILTSDAVEHRAAETDKKASLVAQAAEVGKSQVFWDNLITNEAEFAAAHAAKSNSHAGWHLVDSFLTGAN
jgi:hypothetical protein